jgi:hypothetical protein
MREFLINKLHEIVHNCLIHPLLPFLPARVARKLHEAHANWAFGGEQNLH